MAVSRETVLRMADLARIALDEDDVDRLVVDLGRVLDYVEMLADVETPDLSAAGRAAAHLRPDSVGESLATEDALSNAPVVRHDHLVVPAFLPEES